MNQTDAYNLGYDNGYRYGSEDRLETKEDLEDWKFICSSCREVLSQTSEFSFICKDINNELPESRQEKLWDKFEEGFTSGFVDSWMVLVLVRKRS